MFAKSSLMAIVCLGALYPVSLNAEQAVALNGRPQLTAPKLPVVRSECLSSYDDCMERAPSYCQDATSSAPDYSRAMDYSHCLNQYHENCRASYCD